MAQIIIILILAFIQNTSHSLVSRSRNRDNMTYHIIAATFSNTIWFLTFRALVKADMNYILFLPYCIGTVFGSLAGVKIAMFIEKILGASADKHLQKDKEKIIPRKDKENFCIYPSILNCNNCHYVNHCKSDDKHCFIDNNFND